MGVVRRIALRRVLTRIFTTKKSDQIDGEQGHTEAFDIVKVLAVLATAEFALSRFMPRPPQDHVWSVAGM